MRGDTLSGEHRLVDGQRDAGVQVEVGADPVAALKEHKVAHHEFLGVDLVTVSVAHNHGARGQQVPQPLRRPVGSELLNEGE